MGRLNKWIEDNFTEEPEKPNEDKLGAIMALSHKEFTEMDLVNVERAIFILSSWLYYIGYQNGILQGRANAIKNSLDTDIAFEAQKLKNGYFPERCEIAKSNNPELRERSQKYFELKAKTGTLNEMKFAIKDKVDAIKMIYYRRRNERSTSE